jgi:hypothetical protein
MTVSVLLSTAMASDLLRTATESLLNRFCLTLPTYFRRLVALFPQHASEEDRVNTTTRGFQEYQMLFRRDGQAQLFASAEEEPAVAQGRAISFSLGLGCLRYRHRVYSHFCGYIPEEELAEFASNYLLTLIVTASELLSSSLWDSQTEEEIWTPVEAAASQTGRVVLGGIWLDCCEFKDVSSMIVKDIPPMIDEMPKVWFVYGDLVNNNT